MEGYVSSFVGGGSGSADKGRRVRCSRSRGNWVAKTTVYSSGRGPSFAETVGEDTPVYDVNGNKLALTDVVSEGGKTTVISWLRHYGCSLCRKQVADLSRLSDSGLDELKNVDLIAIGSGTAEQGAEFLKEVKFPGEVYSDPQRKTYKALNFTKGVLSTFNPAGLGKLMESFSSGNKQRFEVIPTDPFQQGGCLVVSPSNEVVLLHRDDFAGDHVEESKLLQALKSV
ncbi:hypothetical protein NDN08_002017 [Rhodosorus marinus]|uniref:Thioredoxin domain-containing protein n=1 Tax=Rhodosorus marinus TaxID=101924 RepID=A0AAV8USG8_9RHOD|nr:hypothetical protein NDN08_002017 [Rhodosorus marinus]